MQPLKSQRQYDLAKRDAENITKQITQLSEKFNADIDVLESQIEAKKQARDQATEFLREQFEEITEALEAFKPAQKKDGEGEGK